MAMFLRNFRQKKEGRAGVWGVKHLLDIERCLMGRKHWEKKIPNLLPSRHAEEEERASGDKK